MLQLPGCSAGIEHHRDGEAEPLQRVWEARRDQPPGGSSQLHPEAGGMGGAPTMCTAFAKMNGLFRLVLSATTTTAPRCMLPLLPGARRGLPQRGGAAARGAADNTVRGGRALIRTGRHRDVDGGLRGEGWMSRVAFNCRRECRFRSVWCKVRSINYCK